MANLKIVPELYCSNFLQSLQFYTKNLGFTVRYQRPEDQFAYLEREGAELMIEQTIEPARTLVADELVHPYGRGINLQIEVSDVETLYAAVQAAHCRIFLPLEEKWYRIGETETGNHQFVVMDPDGYMLRFTQSLGSRSGISK